MSRDASPEVAALRRAVAAVCRGPLPEMGLAAGARPAADVDELVSTVAAAEYELARRMAAAAAAGALPLAGEGAMVTARRWSPRWARRLARAGAFAARHQPVARAWRDGRITSEHVAALAGTADELTDEEMAAVVDQLTPRWGRITPEALTRFLARVARALHPPEDPDPDEADAYTSRGLSFSVYRDTVLLAGTLPRIEGEAVIAAVEAWAEKLRTAADHVPATARRADGLVALVNHAAATATLPTRGGLPVALTVTLDTTPAGDPAWTTSRGHPLTPAEARFTACTADTTPLLIRPRGTGTAPTAGPQPGPTTRIHGLAAVLLDSSAPLALGRTQRAASPAQRRALAARDHGCIMPGCAVPAENCQTHHLVDWANGGPTDLPNLVLLCWTHHRQVDLRMWTITPTNPTNPPPDHTGPHWPGNNGSPWTITPTPRTHWHPHPTPQPATTGTTPA